jgi:hypothetical protein
MEGMILRPAIREPGLKPAGIDMNFRRAEALRLILNANAKTKAKANAKTNAKTSAKAKTARGQMQRQGQMRGFFAPLRMTDDCGDGIGMTDDLRDGRRRIFVRATSTTKNVLRHGGLSPVIFGRENAQAGGLRIF